MLVVVVMKRTVRPAMVDSDEIVDGARVRKVG